MKSDVHSEAQDGFGDRARGLAGSLITRSDLQPALDIYSKANRLAEWLDKVRRYCRQPKSSDARAADWLLDNDYQVLRAIRQIRDGFPRQFFERLTVVEAEAGEQSPRIFLLAHALSDGNNGPISLQNLTRYIESFQEVEELSTAELWALPSMLRLANLELLATAFHRLDHDLTPPFRPSRAQSIGDPTDIIARAIVNLAAVHSITWADFVDQTSLVEAALKSDPAGIYAHMNFRTRDSYRKSVERIAEDSDGSETEVARLAVRLSQLQKGGSPQDHVGYWLIGQGLPQLEDSAVCPISFGESLNRFFKPFRPAGYAAILSFFVLVALAVPAYHLASHSAPLWAWMAGLVLSFLPATVLSITAVHWLIPRLISPHELPAIDMTKGIPDDCLTAVVVPVIISDPSEVDPITRLLETRYLANSDPNLFFVLLSDFSDAHQEHLPGDTAIEDALVSRIQALNQRHDRDGGDRFFLLHRPRLFNKSEGRWMGWERKRGKLEQFNRLVQGASDDFFSVSVGHQQNLRRVRFVITLDADTMLPPGTAAQLIGTLAHPLNSARIDEATGRVVSGFTILQPRMEILPSVGSETPFSHLCSGDTAIDIYTHAVSDVYQDLFGTGVFVGKGIYEVAPLQRCLDNKVPENAILSHDLFEGLFCRTALATNIVLYESFPSNYPEYAMRLHRWLRGDWQLIPWIAGRVPGADGTLIKNPFSGLDRWKIIDNLRRSLIAPSILLFLISGWIVLPGNAWLWTLLAVAAPGSYLVGDFVAGLPRHIRRGFTGGLLHRMKERGGRWFLAITFLVSDALVSLDAILRTLWRLFVSRRLLLQWRSAAQTTVMVSSRNSRLSLWRFMWPSPAFSLGLAVFLALFDTLALLPASPLLILWFVAPEIAHWTGRPRSIRKERPDATQSGFLRRVARRTWHYFEAFTGPEDNWLPPDNIQESPNTVIAHRTSPTNIGMYLVSALAARDFGFIGTQEFVSRARHVMESLSRMETYRGHILNWYDTRNLEPLEPRYVSTVDSGNLALCLIAIKQGCRELASTPAVDHAIWDGLDCAYDMLSHATRNLSAWEHGAAEKFDRDFRAHMEEVGRNGEKWHAVLTRLTAEFWPDFERWIGRMMETSERPAPDDLRDLHIWLERFDHHLKVMRRDLDILCPWYEALESPPAGQEPLAGELMDCLNALQMSDCRDRDKARCLSVIESALHSGQTGEKARTWLECLRQRVEQGIARQVALRADLLDVAEIAEDAAFGMDFTFLYDHDVRLFHIGYDLSSGQMDSNHYDLLATEARLASFFAIAKQDVPIEHWYYLGRPITRLQGRPSVLSWNGSMFEYLMPPLFLPGKRDTLLGESGSTAVEYQRRYAKRRGVPWGISESAFIVTDADGNYQYRAFGAPGLGIRRGLTDDLVIAPYASALALCVWPNAAVRNLQHLQRLGALRSFGFIDALDYTPDRIPPEPGFALVKTHMAHHQGMTIAAISNLLDNDRIIDRVLSEPRLKPVEYLLQEKIPWSLPTEPGRINEEWDTGDAATNLPHLSPWIPTAIAFMTQTHLIGNGRMSMAISEGGSGGLTWNRIALTRWFPDPTREQDGSWIYIRDVNSQKLWSIGRQPTGDASADESVVFHQHMVEMLRRENGITSRLEATIAPGDDVEIRNIRVTNEEPVDRTIEFITYAEVALAHPQDDERHPAFSKLFVGSVHLPEESGILFERRPRRPELRYPVLLHKLETDDPAIMVTGFETDRARFIGRNGNMRSPQGLKDGLSATTGWTLDPIMSLQIQVRLKPMETKSFSILSIAAASRAAVLEIAHRYRISNVDWAFRDAAREMAREVNRLELDPQILPDLQALSSLILHPHPALRIAAETVDTNTHGQPDLWRFGISGDLPIVLIRMGDEDETALLDLLVRAQQLWRRSGLQVDILALRIGPEGYEEPVRDRILSILRDAHAYGFLGRSGGVHILSASHMDTQSRRAVEAAAVVVLQEGDGSLGQALDRILDRRKPTPPFEPSAPIHIEPISPVNRPEDLTFDNGYGGFDIFNGEYVIHLSPNQSTPAPWCNVLANDAFGTIVSEAGLGFSWAVNSGENRLTPWSNDPVADTPGEVLYLRDEATAKKWTVTPAPLGRAETCLVRHGLGYTSWEQHSHALEQEMLVCVPLDEPIKIIRLRLKNRSSLDRRITATYYAEWLLGSLGSSAKPHICCIYDSASQALLANNGWNPEFAARIAFSTATKAPHSVSGDRFGFLGHGGSADDPAALGRWSLDGNFTPGGDACAAYQVHLDIPAGGDAEVCFILGQGSDHEQAETLIEHWRNPQNIEAAIAALHDWWENRLHTVQVATPDQAFDLMINQWLPHQTLSSRIMARAGFYQAGGAFGFRDQLQDVLSLLHSEPTRVRNHILESARHQFEEGDALHWWHPPSGRGVRTRCSDDYLWLPFVTASYVEATGDRSLLDVEVPFLRGAELQPDQADHYAQFDIGETASLFEHCARALDRMAVTGRHGLPLIGSGDWNDGMDRVGMQGKGESVWLAWFQIEVTGKFAPFAAKRGEKGRASRWRSHARKLKSAVDKSGWDGEWFVRAYDDDGEPWGSRTLDECRIDSIAQSWSVLSGATNEERARTAMASAARHLIDADNRLVKLLDPPFHDTPRDPGYIKAYPPGIRENGGQYTHAATWLGLAFAKSGDGDMAWRIFDMINPIGATATQQDADRYAREPYVLAGDVSSLASRPGFGGWSWYTGAAGWAWQLGVDGILGLTPVAGAVRLDPCLPKNWGRAELMLTNTRGTIRIVIEDPDHVGKGVLWITADGRKLRGNKVRYPGRNKTREVLVRLGSDD
ncbi:MAG: DUF3131 domain-containing protein [Alphaproteobacteria bacterium]|nr:DUF3131 domain-containing protein [Alphaproteobacteria bacterium]